MDLSSFLDNNQIKDLSKVISQAELLTSGEIRLHLERKCEIETESRAIEVFEALGMGNTELRNAVLIYISYGDQKFAICGDKGIHEKVSNQQVSRDKDPLLFLFFLHHEFYLCR